ncbi:MAG: hypothetical protein ACLR5H_11920 [Oscillospiraceae bacterium]
MRQLCEETYGGLTLDSLSAAMADNREIGEFWDGYASRYFVAPPRTAPRCPGRGPGCTAPIPSPWPFMTMCW